MKTQALVLAVAAILPIPALADAPKTAPAGAAESSAISPADAQVKAALALTEQQIKTSTDRDSLAMLAQLYSGRDLQRFTWVLERLVDLMPNSGDLKLQLAAVYAGQGDKTKTYDRLLRMQTQGFAYDIATDPRFAKVHGTKVWDYIVANLEANAKPFGKGGVAFEVPRSERLIESIGWDPKRKKFLLGTAREGSIVLADATGKIEEFIKPDPAAGLYSVLDFRVDAERDALWVLSGALPVYKQFKPDYLGKTWLLKYRLSDGKQLARIAPVGDGTHLLTSLAVAPNGNVFAADAGRREIYRLDGDTLKVLAANQKLKDIRGMAVSGDGNTLYFADHGIGLFGIDLKTAKPFDVRHSTERLVVGGIESVHWYDNTLVVVESGMVPTRIMRLKLDKEGRAIESAMPLEAAQPALVMPTQSVAVGQDLYVIANSQRYAYDGYGVLRDEKLLQPVQVYKTDLRFAWDQPGIGTGLTPLPVTLPASGKAQYTPPGTPRDAAPAPADKK